MVRRGWKLALWAAVAGTIMGVAGSRADTSGSGFFVNAFWVMTNDHVVDGCARVEVPGHGTAQDILRDPDSDLAVIRLDQPFDGRALSFRAGDVRLAEPVHVLGYPLASVLSVSVRVTSGSVSALSAFAVDDGLIQISAPVQPGNSGGPVIDDSGQVVGVAVGVLNRSGAQNVNFAISGSIAQEFLNRRAIAHQRAQAVGTPAPLPDVIESAAAATVFVTCHRAGGSPAPAPTSQTADGFVMASGRDMIGHDFRFLRNTSLPGCRSACERDRRCRAFTFNLRHNACFLKEGGTLMVTNADAISGHVPALGAGLIDTGFTVAADVDSPGGDYLRIRQSSFIGCIAECALDDLCSAFAYVRATRDCWLKDRVGRLQPMPGVEFGSRR